MSEVSLELDGGVAVLTLDAPERRNALTSDMAMQMLALLGDVDENRGVGALVIQAQGRSFCAGADLSTLKGAGSDPAADKVYKSVGNIYESFARVGRLKVPTISAVHGAAVGAGLNLVLATDLRIVARTARLISGFSELGIHPGGGHFSLLGRALPREAAAAMGVFGDEIDGERAVALGLAWEAVEADEVQATALTYAQRLGRDPELSRTMIEHFRMEIGPPGLPWEAALHSERSAQMWSLRRKT